MQIEQLLRRRLHPKRAQPAHELAALPMQEVYVSGEQVGRVTGNSPDKVEPMLLDALKKSS